MTAAVDMAFEQDLDVVARIAFELAEKIRDDDPRRVHRELTGLCERHPVKAAQVIMALAAWLDPEEPVQELWRRVENVTRSRIDRRLECPARAARNAMNATAAVTASTAAPNRIRLGGRAATTATAHTNSTHRPAYD